MNEHDTGVLDTLRDAMDNAKHTCCSNASGSSAAGPRAADLSLTLLVAMTRLYPCRACII